MTAPSRPPQAIEMVPVDALHVLNPRARNRRQHRPTDVMAEIGNLAIRGYNDSETTEEVGCSRS